MRSAKTIDYVNLDPGRASIPGPTPKRLVGTPQPVDRLKVLPRYRDLTEGGATAPPPPTGPRTPPTTGPGNVTTSREPALGPSNVNTERSPVSGPSGVTAEEAIVTAGFIITIREPKADILARTGDPIGTIAFATDTKDIYVFNTTGFDKWSSYEDN